MPSIAGNEPGAERDRPPLASGRFVILAHDCAEPHFDLMLERDGSLATWAIEAPPTSTPGIAHELPPHRVAYLTREGELSGGRGSVKRIAQGHYETQAWTPETRVVRLHGERLIPIPGEKHGMNGILRLNRAPVDDSPRGPAWIATFHSER